MPRPPKARHSVQHGRHGPSGPSGPEPAAAICPGAWARGEGGGGTHFTEGHPNPNLKEKNTTPERIKTKNLWLTEERVSIAEADPDASAEGCPGVPGGPL